MARLRWMENARTGDKGTVCTYSNKLFFKDKYAYVNCDDSKTLVLHGDTKVYVDGDLDVSGGLSYGSETVTLNQSLQGTLTVGTSGTGYDVTFYADSSYNWLWDGGAHRMTVTGLTTLDGAVTITGALTVGSSDSGHAIIFWGDSGTKYWKWIDSTNTMDVKGDVDIQGDTTLTGALTVSTTLAVAGNTTITTGTLTVGDSTPGDVKFIGDADSHQWLWDVDGGTGSHGSVVMKGDWTCVGVVTITGAVNITGKLTMVSTNQIDFNDSSQYIKGSSSTQLDIVATTIAISGAITADSTITVAQNSGATVNTNGIKETLTISGDVTNSASGLRVLAVCDGSARTIENFFGGNVAARLVHASDAITGLMAGLQVGADMGAATTSGMWVYGINIDLTEVTTRAAAPKAFIDFQDYDSGGTYRCPNLFDVGGNGSMCSTGTSGDLHYNDTLRIIVNTTAKFIPLSSAEGTFTTAYPIVSTSTIGLTLAALTAGDAYSGIRCAVTADNPDNGYGASGYFQADITGTQAAHFYGLGSWVNIANAAIGGGAGKYLCAQDNGIYVDTPGGEWANTLVVFGMRAECIGLDSDTKRFPFSINTGGTYGLTALFDINSLDEMSRIASGTGQNEYVPIFRTSAGDMRYVKLYTAA